MDKILWFCRSGDISSLSRITDSVLPLLKNKLDVTLLSNGSNISGIKHIKMGEDCSSIRYTDYIKDISIVTDNDRRVANMKYILVQITDAIFEGNYKYLMLCNGIYEIDWFSKILTSNKLFLTNRNGEVTKLVVWSPIDYIPSYKVVENVLKADLFLTMTPVMVQKILDISPSASVKWVGHGSDISEFNCSREDAIKYMNDKITKGDIISRNSLSDSDIIILNANNYGPLDPLNSTHGTRKRLDITVRSFIKLLGTLDLNAVKKTKLWIHTNLKYFFQMLKRENIDMSNISESLILSDNNMTNEEMCMMYKISYISLQTSLSEGWSLTNMEAAVYGSLQIVPDFLACGWHFREGRGILIPVTEKIIKNEAGYDVIVGEVSVDDTCNALVTGISMIGSDTLDGMTGLAKEYAKSYTWSSVVDNLFNCISSD